MRYALGLVMAAAMITVIGLAVAGHAEATNTTTNTTVTDIVAKAMSNPKVAIATLIQFLLGFALGYYSVKIARYLLAWIGVIILGSLLSVWSLGGSAEDILTKIGAEAKKVLPIVKDFLAALGILTVGPVAVGFILGLIVGFTRK
ncbi:hypothetical protein PYJP_12840 [Pyrofollis japonicus]|uniref:hypothetical protein n=1 Tax=Pyrofollis japonicus TaxID=3060460 RepID=UPI00295B68C9|nr:hypothetical protein [Pyrofollis japonicus]BEP17932.1 hypothetical protein PYJP_12840 [Pyrofollis japonicus]